MLRKSLRWAGNAFLAGIMGSQLLAVVGTVAAQSIQSPSPHTVDTAAAKNLTIDFDHFPTDLVPDDFTPVRSGVGESGRWEIRPEPTAPSGQKVLAQTSSEEMNFRFPLLLYNKLTAKNVEVAVFFKPISGKIDQAAGLVVRYQDEDRFYAVRANALEDEVRLYKVIAGVPHSIAGANAPVMTGEWHWMKLTVHETHFQVFCDGALLFEADDTTYGQAGQIGLSTKSDGVIVFDDWQITPADK